MTKINENTILFGASGMFGDQVVFRNLNGQTIMARRPRRTNKRTEAQKAHALRFKDATIYAKAALTDEDTHKAYAKKAVTFEKYLTAYNIAVADFMNAPVIEEINLNNYSGQAGERITVYATDDFEVKEVTIEIRDSNNMLVEKGKALLPANSLDWEYTTQSVNTALTGCVVSVSVSDRPGNVTIKNLSL